MRILVSLSHAGQARNLEWVLRLLGKRGHDVTVVLHREERGSAGAEILAQLEGPALRVERAPRRRARSRLAVALRLALDYARYLEPAYAGADVLRARAARATPWPLRLVVDGAQRLRLGGLLRALLRAGERLASDTSLLAALIVERRSELVLVTPLVDLGAPQVEVVRAALYLDVPVALLLASWDNLTTKGTLHELPDRVLVWNAVQRDEAVRLHGVPGERIELVGAAAWDHWLDPEPATSRAEHCAAVGVDPALPYVLYLGSSPILAPGEGEFLAAWLDSVRALGSATPQVLVRPHPLNPLAPATLALLAARPGVAVQETDPGAGADARRAYRDAVLHSAAVVGLNTSGLLEAVAADRPALVPTTERYRATQWGTLHFRDILAASGSPLEIAPLGPEHRAQLERALADPQEGAERRRTFVATFVRPQGAGTPAAACVVEALERLA
jgi:hypothetical protein